MSGQERMVSTKRADGGGRLSGRRVALGFVLLLLALAGSGIGAFLATRTPDGEVLALAAVDDTRVVLLRADPRRGHPYLTLESTEGTLRSAALFGLPAHPSLQVRDGIVTVPVTGARGHHEVDGFGLEALDFRYRTARPEPEAEPPAALPATVSAGGLETAAYGDPPRQFVAFTRGDGVERFRVHLPEGEDVSEVVRLDPTARGFFTLDARGLSRLYDRSNDARRRPPRDSAPVGGEGATFCRLGGSWLFLTRVGSLHRLEPRGAVSRVMDGLPPGAKLRGCGERGDKTWLFLGADGSGAVTSVVGFWAGREPVVIVVDAATPAAHSRGSEGPDDPLPLPAHLPRHLPVRARDAWVVVDLEAATIERAPACWRGRMPVVMPEASYLIGQDRVLRLDGEDGSVSAYQVPGVAVGSLSEPHFSQHTLYVMAGSGFVAFDRASFERRGARMVEGVEPLPCDAP